MFFILITELILAASIIALAILVVRKFPDLNGLPEFELENNEIKEENKTVGAAKVSPKIFKSLSEKGKKIIPVLDKSEKNKGEEKEAVIKREKREGSTGFSEDFWSKIKRD